MTQTTRRQALVQLAASAAALAAPWVHALAGWPT